MDIDKILSICDHTWLKPNCSAAEIRVICDEAIEYGCASVCIPPCHVAGAKRYVGDKMKICTVIGFPNGYNTTAAKVFETEDAVKNGADEIDMVINLSMVRDACWDEIVREIKAVREAADGRIVKVIIECCLLSHNQKVKVCDAVTRSGAEFIKTSTGFSTGGATPLDVELLRKCCPERVKVKAAGGIASLEDAEEFIKLGADRLGTSRLVKIARTAKENEITGFPPIG